MADGSLFDTPTRSRFRHILSGAMALRALPKSPSLEMDRAITRQGQVIPVTLPRNFAKRAETLKAWNTRNGHILASGGLGLVLVLLSLPDQADAQTPGMIDASQMEGVARSVMNADGSVTLILDNGTSVTLPAGSYTVSGGAILISPEVAQSLAEAMATDAPAADPAIGSGIGSGGMALLAVAGGVALVGLAAGGSSGDSPAPDSGTDTGTDTGSDSGTDTDTDTDLTVTSDGSVIDGYLVGATVFRDLNGNGTLDDSEPFVLTDSEGNFSGLEGADSGATIVATGGTDATTGEAFTGTLTAPAGSDVVTPLTTLVQSYIEAQAEAGTTVSAGDAAALVADLLGLDGLDLLTYDPVETAAEGGDLTGYANAAALAALITTVTADGGDVAAALSSVLTQLAATEGSPDLSAILSQAATDAGSADVAEVLGQAVTSLTGATTLKDILAVQTVVQGDLTEAITAGETPDGSDFSDALDSAVAAASAVTLTTSSGADLGRLLYDNNINGAFQDGTDQTTTEVSEDGTTATLTTGTLVLTLTGAAFALDQTDDTTTAEITGGLVTGLTVTLDGETLYAVTGLLESYATIEAALSDLAEAAGQVSAGDVNYGLSAWDTLLAGYTVTYADIDSGVLIRGSAGDDTLTGGAEDDILLGFAGDDVLSGGDGSDYLYGGSGDDTLIGGAGEEDEFEGGAGDDTITVGSSSAYIVAGSGDDTIDGSASDDVQITYQNATAGVTVDLAEGTADDGMGGTDTLIGVNHLRGSVYDDTLTGDDGDNRIAGLAGDDVIDGGAGTDTVFYYRDGTEDGVYVDLSAGFAMDGAGDIDTLSNIENIDGSDSDDILIGDDGDNRIRGREGSDEIYGGAGNDTLIGGATGEDEDTIEDGEGDDTIISGTGYLYVRASAGNDTIDGSASLETNITYVESPDGVTVDLGAGTATDGWGDTDTLIGVTAVRGSNYDDSLTGSDADNRIAGLAGNDVIDGGEGTDTVYYYRDLTNSDGYRGAYVNLAEGYAIDGTGSTDTLISIEGADGTIFSDVLIGDAGDNILRGRQGNDTLIGGSGDDIMIGGGGDEYNRYEIDGSDTFIHVAGNDVIMDFEIGTDNFEAEGLSDSELAAAFAAATDTTYEGSAAVLVDLGDNGSVTFVGITAAEVATVLDGGTAQQLLATSFTQVGAMDALVYAISADENETVIYSGDSSQISFSLATGSLYGDATLLVSGSDLAVEVTDLGDGDCDMSVSGTVSGATLTDGDGNTIMSLSGLELDFESFVGALDDATDDDWTALNTIEASVETTYQGNDMAESYEFGGSGTIYGEGGDDDLLIFGGEEVFVDTGAGDDSVDLTYSSGSVTVLADGDGEDLVTGFSFADALEGGDYLQLDYSADEVNLITIQVADIDNFTDDDVQAVLDQADGDLVNILLAVDDNGDGVMGTVDTQAQELDTTLMSLSEVSSFDPDSAASHILYSQPDV